MRGSILLGGSIMKLLFEKKYIIKAQMLEKVKLLLPDSEGLTMFYPPDLREDYDFLSDILEEKSVYTYDDFALIKKNDTNLDTWVSALDYLLQRWGTRVVVPLYLFLGEDLNALTYDGFLKEIQYALIEKGYTPKELNCIEVYVNF